MSEGMHILADLRAKASRFGQLDLPYVIAVLLRRKFVRDDDVEHALFGSEVVRLTVGPDGPVGEATLDRDPHGLWQRGEDNRGTRVSAVLSVLRLHSWSIGSEEPRVWHNPWAALPLATTLPWQRTMADLSTKQLATHEATAKTSDIFSG